MGALAAVSLTLADFGVIVGIIASVCAGMAYILSKMFSTEREYNDRTYQKLCDANECKISIRADFSNALGEVREALAKIDTKLELLLDGRIKIQDN